MKKYLFTIVLIIVASGFCFSQQAYVKLEYTYDGNGNRITRDKQIIFYKKNPDKPSFNNNLEIKPDKSLAIDESGIKYSVFPNPSSGLFKLRVESSFQIDCIKIDVFNVLGSLVYSKNLNELESLIDLNGLNDGVYELRLSREASTIIFKIIKSN